MEYVTTPGYPTETDSAAAFDQEVARYPQLFSVYSECRGWMIHCRPGQEFHRVKIDRILVPRTPLVQQGWGLGAIGVELKRSGVNLGPVFAQSDDYRSSIFEIGKARIRVYLEQVCVWPFPRDFGGVPACWAAQKRLGGVRLGWQGRLEFTIGQERLLTCCPDGTVTLGHGYRQSPGHRVGSR